MKATGKAGKPRGAKDQQRNPPAKLGPRSTTAQHATGTRAMRDSDAWIRNAELYDAAGRGDVALVKSLLAQGADPEYRGEEEMPLHEAVIYGHAGRMEVARLLIEQQWSNDGAAVMCSSDGRWTDPYVDADSEFGTPLGIAVDNDDVLMVEFLLGYGAHPDADGCGGGTPLHRAAKSGNVQILQLLLDQLERQMEENQWEEEGSYVDVVSSHLDIDDTTPLHLAAGAGHLPAVKLLAAAGADVNAADAEGETPLCKAARAGSAKIVRWLLAHGAAVEGTKDRSPLAAAAMADQSPLLAAIETEARGVVAILMQAGANLDGTYNGSTALTLASKLHRSRISYMLQGLVGFPKRRASARRKPKGRPKQNNSGKAQE